MVVYTFLYTRFFNAGAKHKEPVYMPPSTHLLLGVTGGIATGKSTVANMFEEHGAAIIDFDVLARRVVEPDRPAWKDIVDYFGQEILLEDRTLDRKKLSGIVFTDAEKRKKLEGLIHPRTGVEYAEQIDRITAADPNAVIQAVVPLLFEAKMQDMFEKILLVYTPRETQVERLVVRDGISEEEAGRILDAQLPIDEKIGFADFVINNEKGLEATKKQVEDLWEKLKKIQADKQAG
jgi:dephospho-CoA kinase